MESKHQKRSEQAEKENKQPGDLTSFNNRDTKRSTQSEEAEEMKKTGDKKIQNNPAKDGQV
jgi:hypothetical protein